MSSESFADAVTSVMISGPLIRIDFATYAHPNEWKPEHAQNGAQPQSGQPGTQQDGPPLMPRHRVVIPIEGFVKAFSIQEQIMRQLIQSGIVKTGEPPKG